MGYEGNTVWVGANFPAYQHGITENAWDYVMIPVMDYKRDGLGRRLYPRRTCGGITCLLA
jgi:hypothetical protein